MPEYMNVNLKAYVGSSRGKWDYSVSYSELANSAIPLVLRKQEYPSQFTIAEHYALQGNYMEAIKHCIIALNESKLNNRIKANMELKLGFWYCWLDKNNEAIKTLVPLIDTFLILNDKKNLALCYNYIGLVYDEMGKWSSSEFNYIQAMKVYDELKAETTGVFDLRKECFQCFANIGLMYFRWGQSTASSIYFGNAKEYYEKALTFFESNEKALQNDAAIFFNNYALFCDNQKNYEKAIELYNKALYIKSKTLGQWHISSARIYSNLGLVYYNLQCYEKSILNCETAYRIYKEYDELDCRDALRNLGTLASSKAKNGDKEEALNLLYKQEDMRVKLYGEDSTDLAQTYNNIGNVLVSCNSFSKAEIYLKKALEIRNLKMPTHRYTIETMQQLANLYVLIGYYDEALKWYEKIKNLQINILGKDSKETIDTVSQINNLINIVSKIKN